MKQQSLFTQKGIYLLPNLLTSTGLFAGFYAIVAGMQNHYASAAIAIFVAMIADTLDGRVARLMNANTAFGMQYDSLADMVSFGLAPALLMYSWALHQLGKLGWLLAFLYAASVALRLARFNTQEPASHKHFFKGLPSPLGAGTIAAFVWLLSRVHIAFFGVIIVAILSVIIAALMVSNVRYHSFKELDFKGRLPFFSLLIVLLLFVAVSVEPPTVLFTLGSLYIISGPILTFFHWRKLKRLRQKRKDEVNN
jgi:CDP-diacylglycerol--serine O-phosphatidyltransferase